MVLRLKDSRWQGANLRGAEEPSVPWREILAVALIAAVIWLNSQGL